MKAYKTDAAPYAVITGASQGLGRSFAMEFARRKVNLILVSLPNQNLSGLGLEISEAYGIESIYYETDLSSTQNVIDLCSWINRNFKVSFLINNAGLGGTKKFTDANVAYINQIMQVNVVATSVLTHQLLPNLLQQEKGYILNVSSMAAFLPTGYKTVYPASKTFIHSFSRGLYAELKNTTVFVSVVNPGAMKTNADVVNRIKKQGLLGRLTLLDPDKVAHFCINRLLKRDTVIMVNGISWAIIKLLPVWIMLPLMTRTVKREIEA